MLHDGENGSDTRARELEKRIAELERRLDGMAQVLSRHRLQSRRRWLHPPLWVFEQYEPRPLQVGVHREDRQSPSRLLPTIAIVTPTFNRRSYLQATIDSVLGQAYPALNYHVQDGGSTDQTQELLGSYGSRLSWRSERDAGQAQAINNGLAMCDGEIMAYLNSDDLLLPGTLAYVAHLFQSRPDIDFVYGHRIFIDGIGREIGRAVLPRHDKKAIYWACYVPQETMFWRRRVWTEVGPFDERLHYALDWDFIARVQAAGFKFLRAPRFLACFRVHDQQKVATIYDRGHAEMQEVRRRYLGYEPAHGEVIRNMLPYMVRQFALHWLYRSQLVTY